MAIDYSDDLLRWRWGAGHASRQTIAEALRTRVPEEAHIVPAWEHAARILSGKTLTYHGDMDLDDTADINYSITLNREEFQAVTAGIAARCLFPRVFGDARALVLKSAGYDYGSNGQSGTLRFSRAVAGLLQDLIPDLKAETYDLSAGHSGTRQFDPALNRDASRREPAAHPRINPAGAASFDKGT